MVLAVLHVTWTCLGIDGVRGIAYPKPIKVLKYAQLGSLLLGEKRCSQKQIQVVDVQKASLGFLERSVAVHRGVQALPAGDQARDTPGGEAGDRKVCCSSSPGADGL